MSENAHQLSHNKYSFSETPVGESLLSDNRLATEARVRDGFQQGQNICVGTWDWNGRTRWEIRSYSFCSADSSFV